MKRNRVRHEQHARAANWMAAESKSRPEVCCRWPNRYPAEWQQAYQAGRWKVVYEVHIEAVQTLKDLLHSKDERIRANAAELLKRYAREQASAGNEGGEQCGSDRTAVVAAG